MVALSGEAILWVKIKLLSRYLLRLLFCSQLSYNGCADDALSVIRRRRRGLDLFQISPYFRKFSDCRKFYLFPKSFSIFIRQNFWWPFFLFLVIDHNFRIPPIFPVSVHFPPVSRKLLFPPALKNFPLCFRKIHLLFRYFMCISFPPYFDHDTFMHHSMNVLDAPAGRSVYRYLVQIHTRAELLRDVGCTCAP